MSPKEMMPTVGKGELGAIVASVILGVIGYLFLFRKTKTDVCLFPKGNRILD